MATLARRRVQHVLGALSISIATGVLALPGAAADLSFSDPVGDSGIAPDITQGSVTSDREGDVTFTIATDRRALGSDASISVHVDSDLNPSTGLPLRGLGVDHFFSYRGGLGLPFLWHVSGNYLIIDLQSTLTFSYNGTLTARVNASDLGDTEQFAFVVATEQEDTNGATLGADFAPDVGSLQHTIPAKLVVAIGKPAPTSRPRAGKLLVVSAPVTRNDGEPFASGSVACTARIGAKAIRTGGRVKTGSARCSMRIPADARGKRLQGAMTVRVAGAEPATRSFVLRVG